MKPNQKVPRPDPPMPYDAEETAPIPYEVDISSRSDLNTPKPEISSATNEQAKDTSFIQSQSMELNESDIENEPDEKVYTAEPQAANAVSNDINEDSAATNAQAVQPYNEEAAAVDTSTTQTAAIQSNEIKAAPGVPLTTESSQQPLQQQEAVSQQSQQLQPQIQAQSQVQAQSQTVQTNTPVQNVETQTPKPQSIQSQPVQSQQMPSQPALEQSQPVQAQVPVQASQTQPVQNPQQMQQNQVEKSNVAQAAQNTSEEQKSANQQQADMSQSMTPAQLAQAQAMMMAQFNQMQMAQAMQQAMAQVQAQAQEQVRQVYLQAQQEQQQYREHLNNEQKSSMPSVKSSNESPESQDKIKKLENEIAQMKALLAQVMGKDNKQGSISLHEALRRQEVNEDILNIMAATAEAGETLADSQSREAKATLIKFLNDNISFSEGIKLNRHGVRIAALLGTTGVGKTTTLAKIAAKFVLEQGISAALITADTYRISAVEQLRTYSDILGLPLEIVYSPAELSKAINRHRNKDLILIDTAGRSQHNDYQMKELQEFLAANQRIEKHIVLSTTTKSSDAKDILEKFAVCEPDKVIFTKTDETASLGLLINLLFKQKLSLSYLTNGQSVPDDIIPASAQVLTDLLLRKNV